jgi:hypothetical protein
VFSVQEVTVCIRLAIIYEESKARKHVLEESFCEDRKILSLTVKLDVIRRIEEAGERQIVCKASDFARSTVQCILKNEDKIKDENGK